MGDHRLPPGHARIAEQFDPMRPMSSTALRPRTHVGSAAMQLAEATLSLRNNLIGLQQRINGVGIIDQPIKVDRERDPGAEPSISDLLGDALEFVRISHEILEGLHKELSRG